MSNETSFLHVSQDLIQVAPRGQVYLGAGPSQNFTYVAKIRPSLAFILDLRRDNLRYHLLFKSFFLMAEDRWEFLSFLFSKTLPSREERIPQATVVDLVNGLRYREADWDAFSTRIEKASDLLMERYPRLLDENDRARIHSIAAKFVREGFEIRYEIPGRPMLSFFPSYADLMLETDLHGEHRHYLNSESEFQFIKRMHREKPNHSSDGELWRQKGSGSDWRRDQAERSHRFGILSVQRGVLFVPWPGLPTVCGECTCTSD